MSEVSVSVSARIDALRARGADGWNAPELRYLARLVGFLPEDTISLRLAFFENAFEAARDAAEKQLSSGRFTGDLLDRMRAAFEAGDFLGVEILASTAPHAREVPQSVQAFRDKVRKRAEELGVGIGDGARATSALLSATALDARAAMIAADARALDLSTVGPYNAWALALRVLGRLDEIAPVYLASWVGYLEDVASIAPPAPEPKRGEPKRRRA